MEKINIQLVANAVRQAGQKLLLMSDQKEFKALISADDNKTRADIEINKFLFQALMKITPKIPIFSEEVRHSLSDRPDFYWLIDPIDGTASWLNGYDGYVCQVALINQNLPQIGLIYWPKRDLLFSASSNGIFVNNMQLTQPSVNDPLIIIDNYPTPFSVAANLLSKLPEANYLECGSLGLKAIRTLIGDADIFIKDSIIRDWDMAPAMAFQKFGWGSLLNLRGKPIEIGMAIEFDQGLIVSHDEVLARDTVELLA
jgi:3'(2'), 5'-bisphosphate nucleotidase